MARRNWDAAIIADKIRSILAGTPFSFGDRDYTVTATLGVAAAGERFTVDRLLKSADDALYRGKQAGNYRVRTNPIGAGTVD